MRISWCVAVTIAACGGDDGKPAETTRADTDDTNEAVEVETVETSPDSEPDTAVETVETSPDTSDETDSGPSPEVIGPDGCYALTLSGDLEPYSTVGAFRLGGDVDLGLGGPLPDAVVFEFYSNETGTFDLAANGNQNYKTCTQCLRFVQDIDVDNNGAATNFFQKAGTLIIDEATPPQGRELRVLLEGLEMEEVSIRAIDFQSTPVEDGTCYQAPEAIALETGSCKPECGDHVCGPDGCGGVCGGGCREGQHCLLDGSACQAAVECIQLSLEGTLDNTAAGLFRLDVSERGLGALGGGDFVQIEFYKNDVGTFDLGTAPNRNYSTCNQCFRLVIDGRRELFQRRGKVIVSDVSQPLGSPELDGYVSLQTQGIVLEEVIIDEQFNSMPLPDGACVEIVDGTLASELPEP